MAQGKSSSSRKLAPTKRKRNSFVWGDDEYAPEVRFCVPGNCGPAITIIRSVRVQLLPVAGLEEVSNPNPMSTTSRTKEIDADPPLRSRTPSRDQRLWHTSKSATRTVKLRAFMCRLDLPGRPPRYLCRSYGLLSRVWRWSLLASWCSLLCTLCSMYI